MGRCRGGAIDAWSRCRDHPPEGGRACGTGGRFELRQICVRDGSRRRPSTGVRKGPRCCADPYAGSGVCVMISLVPRWPGFRPLAGSMLFNVASGCFTITLGQALFERSGSVSAFTGVVVIEYLVPILLGAVAGSMADRVQPAVVCAVASIASALALMG